MRTRMAVAILAVTATNYDIAKLAHAQGQRVKLNAGLEAQVEVAARCKSDLSISVRLENKGSDSVHIALIGPPPQATDNGGTNYRFRTQSGVAECPRLVSNEPDVCIGAPSSYSNYQSRIMPTQAYTIIDPGTRAGMIIKFHSSSRSSGNLVSMNARLAYRIVSDPHLEGTLTEPQKRARVATMAVRIPLTPITQGDDCR